MKHLELAGRLLMKFDIEEFYYNFLTYLSFDKSRTKITDPFHEDLHVFLIVSQTYLVTICRVKTFKLEW
jgi:hypothetical protein